jgi:hypothetical protein
MYPNTHQFLFLPTFYANYPSGSVTAKTQVVNNISTNMKNTHSRFSTLLGLVFITWLTSNCNRSEQDTTPPQSTCRLQQYTVTTNSSGFNSTKQTSYEYDPVGNLTKITTTFNQQPTNGTYGTQTSTTTTLYSYDANGYLTTSGSEQQTTSLSFDNKPTTERVSISTSYAYTNGRLSTVTTKNAGAQGVTTTTSESYSYDGSGDLARKTAQSTYVYDPATGKENPAASTGASRIWTYQKNQLTDYVEKSGTSEYRPNTIQNGLVTAFTAAGNHKTIWEYDSQQRQTKISDYVGDTLTRVTSQTWSTAKPATAALTAFKGFPVTVPTSEYGQTGVLGSSSYAYVNTATNKLETFINQTAVIQTNSQGFVTSILTTARHPNPVSASQDYTVTESYTYSGCP